MKEKVNVGYYFNEEIAKTYDEVYQNHPDMMDEFGQQTFNGGYREGSKDGYKDGGMDAFIILGASTFLVGMVSKYVPKVAKFILKKIKK